MCLSVTQEQYSELWIKICEIAAAVGADDSQIATILENQTTIINNQTTMTDILNDLLARPEGYDVCSTAVCALVDGVATTIVKTTLKTLPDMAVVEGFPIYETLDGVAIEGEPEIVPMAQCLTCGESGVQTFVCGGDLGIQSGETNTTITLNNCPEAADAICAAATIGTNPEIVLTFAGDELPDGEATVTIPAGSVTGLDCGTGSVKVGFAADAGLSGNFPVASVAMKKGVVAGKGEVVEGKK